MKVVIHVRGSDSKVLWVKPLTTSHLTPTSQQVHWVNNSVTKMSKNDQVQTLE